VKTKHSDLVGDRPRLHGDHCQFRPGICHSRTVWAGSIPARASRSPAKRTSTGGASLTGRFHPCREDRHSRDRTRTTACGPGPRHLRRVPAVLRQGSGIPREAQPWTIPRLSSEPRTAAGS
jgi:hypothetical protein